LKRRTAVKGLITYYLGPMMKIKFSAIKFTVACRIMIRSQLEYSIMAAGIGYNTSGSYLSIARKILCRVDACRLF